MSKRTARERFVEAMNYLHGFLREPEVEDANVPEFAKKQLRQAVEAFADAECAYRKCPTCPAIDSDMNVNYHAACRAALLRECRLEKRMKHYCCPECGIPCSGLFCSYECVEIWYTRLNNE